jgi:DNA-directed RNA polymerase delta subunit
MTTAATKAQGVDLEDTLVKILGTIDREREREIVARRFGLYERKETLEQIGELLGITRERVRQLEKSVITKLKISAEKGEIPGLSEIEESIIEILDTNGHVMRVIQLAEILTADNSKLNQSRIAFLSTLAPKLAVVDESDHYYNAVGQRSVNDEKKIKELVSKIVDAVKAIKEPADIKVIAEATKMEDPEYTRALASISKHLATLNGKWGLTKWPTVNPKNIRDKIYVILSERGNHMHFNEIADSIKQSEFKRKDVTTQAIHNELIKDKRFVLIGRGIYALSEWGYKKGTVADIITEVLNEAGEPLHRDEIVKRVLKTRHVKETTILLNLQGKDQFKRVAKATYGINEASL